MLIDGKLIANKIYKDIDDKLNGKEVCFVIFKDDPASKKFVEVKTKAAERLGVYTDVVEKDVSTTEEALEVLKEVVAKGYDGVVIQLPLPEGVDAQTLFDALPQEMDMDVLGSAAKASFSNKTSNRIPPVAGAVEEILNYHKIDLKYKEVFVLGKGRLVGEPVSMFLERDHITCISIDKNTPIDELRENLLTADVVVSGIGSPHFIKPDMVKPKSILIDAGTSELNGTLAGDIDPACEEVSSLLTPVPGGVGPVTVAVLYRNLLY